MRTYTFTLRILFVFVATLILSFIGITSIPIVNANNHIDSSGNAHFGALLVGSEEVPPIGTTTTNGATTTGDIHILVDTEQSELTYDLNVANGEALTAAHLHCGAEGEEGPAIMTLFGPLATGTDVHGDLSSGTLDESDLMAASVDCEMVITDIMSLEHAMASGTIYANVHSNLHPDGVVRGQLAPITQPDNNADYTVDDITVEGGTTTVVFTYNDTEYEISVHSTDEGTILAAIADALDTEVQELDDSFVEEISDTLEEELDDDTSGGGVDFEERREQLQERIDSIRERLNDRLDTLRERFDNIFE